MNAAAAALAADKPCWTERRVYGDCKLVADDVNGNCMIRRSINSWSGVISEPELALTASICLVDHSDYTKGQITSTLPTEASRDLKGRSGPRAGIQNYLIKYPFLTLVGYFYFTEHTPVGLEHMGLGKRHVPSFQDMIDLSSRGESSFR